MTAAELLLISPPDYETREFRGAQPLGIAYLAATLRQAGAIHCRLLDANVGGPMPIKELIDQVLAFVAQVQVDGGHPVVGVSVVSQVIGTAVAIAEAVKAVHPETLVIFGGYHPTFAHQEILGDFPAVDLCVRGEGEQTLLEVMQHWRATWRAQGPVPSLGAFDWGSIAGVTWRNGPEIVVNPGRPNLLDLDAVPFPARDLLPSLGAYPLYPDIVAGKMRVKASIMSSRGCPFHCNFCSIISFYGDAGGKPWRGRSVDNVVTEMTHLAQGWDASHFEFQDDNFFVRPDRALAIAERFGNTGHDFSFAFLTRADQIVRGERYIPVLRRAGLRYVSVGIESGSEASLKRMVKQTSVETNRRALQILHENDVAAQVEFIMFEPGSTLADLRDNLRFIEEQGLFGYFPPLIFASLLLLPGTPAREQVEQARGMPGNIHKTLAYLFADQQVASIYRLLEAFRLRMGEAWYGLAFQLLDGIPALEIAQKHQLLDGHSPLVESRQLALLKLEFFALTRIPYTLLRRVLHAATEGHDIPMETLLDDAQAQLHKVEEKLTELDVGTLLKRVG
jgi:radical SAM superfamily enzyme YgiQ (UPF0313 family)